jgi:hypothetical protein
MNTERTPEQIAAELYPSYIGMSSRLNLITDVQRAAWLSRQSEVDRLKRQVEELMAFNETCLQNNKSLTAAKEKELEDLKRQMDGMEKKYLDALDYKDQIHIDVVKDLTNELAAKEKEMEDWKTIANVYKQRNNKLIEP